MVACKAGNVELISVLVKAGADGKICNSNNETCLHAFINSHAHPADEPKPIDSVSKSNIENTVKLLLESGVHVNACCSRGETVLYRTIKAGLEHIVRLLLEAGADTVGSTSHRPLYAACERGYTQIVDLLLLHGADPNASSVSSEYSDVPLSTILPLELELLLGLGLAASSGLPVGCAVKKGYIDIVDLLLKHGADANKQDPWGKSVLIYFIESLASQTCKTSRVADPLEEIKLYILKCMLLTGGDVNRLSDRDDRNALHVASSFGMCDVIMELIEYGANCNQLTSSGTSALDLACEKGHEAAVEMLLKYGAKPDTETATTCHQFVYETAMPVLCRAAKKDSETMLKMLLQYGADVNASDEKGNTALHLATSHSIMETLLNAGANSNATNDNGDTALSIVCAKRQIRTNVVEMLLKYGADPNVNFPLHDACENNDLDAVTLLLAHGADANRVRKSERILCIYDSWMMLLGGNRLHIMATIERSPLCVACKNGNVAMVGCLLQNGADTAFTDSDGNSLLHLAVERLGEQANLEDYDPIITLLLQHNAPVNMDSSSGESPLYLSCMKGLAGVVKQLLDCSAEVGSDSNKYPLLIACQNKFRDVAMMLLQRGADANVSKDHQTPLKFAAGNGDVVLVKMLISCGADVNQMQNISDTALHAVIRQWKSVGDKSFVKILRMLLKNVADVNMLNGNGVTPLYLACRSAGDTVNIGTVQTLLEYGADPNICPPWRDPSLSSPYQALSLFSAAVYCNNSELVLLLLKFGARLDNNDEFGRTALHVAIGNEEMKFARQLESISSNTSTVEILLSAGADVNALDNTGASPLFLACDRGETEFVNLLLSRGANPNNGTKDKIPIHAACRGRHYDSVKLLLEYKADVTACDENGKTALHHALESVSRYDQDCDKSAALVQLLLEEAANVNATSKNGESPIYVACSKGLTSIAKKLFESGAVADVNSGRKLPLIAACRNKHLPVVQLLLTYGADPNVAEPEEGDLALLIAAAGDNSELVELLLKQGANVDVADIRGNTALHLAIQCYYPRASRYSDEDAWSNGKSTIDILLENKANVNTLNVLGETPLYRAVSKELPDVVSNMLQIYGGNPNKCYSPLAAACQKQDLKLADVLLNYAADQNIHDSAQASSHKLPLFIAADRGNIDIIMSLLNAGADVNATDHEGRNVACFAAEKLTDSCNWYASEMNKRLSAIRLLLQHGTNFSTLLPDGNSPLHLVVSVLPSALRHVGWLKTLLELLQLMVEHGAMLLDPSSQLGNVSRQTFNSGILAALDRFDGRHKFIVDLFRAGAGFQLIASCCSAVSTTSTTAKCIAMCQAVVFAGYMPSGEELVNLQLTATNENTSNGLLKQLVNWLNEDRQQVPSLSRQCRVAIRRQLSTAAQHRTILPAIDQLPLPNDMKLYLQFDGQMTEVDLSVNDEQQPLTRETTEETSTENIHHLLSPYSSEESGCDNDSDSDYDDRDYDDDDDVSDSDNDYYYDGNDSDLDLW